MQWGHSQFTNADRYFSPNLDGIKDFIEIPFTIEEENLQRWSLAIFKKDEDKFEQILKHESIHPREEQLNFSKFFSRLVTKDTPLKAPNSYLWEGRDHQGNLVDDGIYYFMIDAIDRWGNKSQTPLIPIVVDTQSPESKFSLETDIFSPNGDGRKEELPLHITSQNFSSLDTWTLTVSDNEGNPVKHFQSSNPELSFTWDGKNDDGEEVVQGTYTLSLRVQDLAGNRSDFKESKIYLVREFEKIGLEVSQPIFSPNQDGFFDNISFETFLSSLEGMEKWVLEIKNESGKIVKTFEDSPFVKVIFYEGHSDEGKILSDGKYSSQLSAWFRSGNQPNSSPVIFRIDTQPPKIGLKMRNKILNPKAIGSGYKNLLVNHFYEELETNSYQIAILKQNGNAVLKRDYVAQHPPKNFFWDGKDEEGKILSGKYVYVFKAKDEVENISTVMSDPFEVIDEDLNVVVEADSTSISPNGDGKLDEITFTLKVNKAYRSILTKGQFTIFNEKNVKVKEFSFTTFPDKLVWDGLKEPKTTARSTQKPTPLADGVYFYNFTAQFQTQEEISLPPEKIYLDTIPVHLEILPHDTVFSPNGDGNKDQIFFSNIYSTSVHRPEIDQFVVVIVKKEGEKEVIFRRKEWQGKFPNDLLWTGKDQVGDDSPEGEYQLRIETVDHALNEKIYFSQSFELVREFQTLDLNIFPDLVTSLSEGSPNQVSITPQVSSPLGLLGVSYTLYLSNEEKIAFNRKDNLNPMEWNLLNQKEETQNAIDLDTGLYYVQAEADYQSGNKPKSPVKTIYVDNAYPIAKANTQPLFFSPDGDGVNDKLSIRIIAEDNDQIQRVVAAIFRKEEIPSKLGPKERYEYYEQRQIPIKTWDWDFESKRFDNQFFWDGKGNVGDLVESATDYVLFVRARDRVGLPVIIEHQFLVDILVERLPDGSLRIILQNINFKYDSDEMLGNYEKTLELLIRMLRKFLDYRIHVVGHTDSRGSDEYNDRLSLKRAKRVVNYLGKVEDIVSERLTSEGKGERELLITDETGVNAQFTKDIQKKIIEDNYRKNRRVEFFLKKD